MPTAAVLAPVAADNCPRGSGVAQLRVCPGVAGILENQLDVLALTESALAGARADRPGGAGADGGVGGGVVCHRHATIVEPAIGIVLRADNTRECRYRGGRSPHGEAATTSRKVSLPPLISSCTCAGNENGGAFVGSAAVPWAIRSVIA